MSALTPHIRVLRAVAHELDIQWAIARDISDDSSNENRTRLMFLQNRSLLAALRDATKTAADKLQDEVDALEQRVAPASSSER